MYAISSPYPQYFDNDGTPLDSGYVFFGAVGQNPITSPISVYWDIEGNTPAAQPLRTLNGFIHRNGTPAQIYANEPCDILVKNKKGILIGNGAKSTLLPSSNITFLPSGAGATLRTVQEKLRDFISVKDFGAKGDGITDDTQAFSKAIDYCELKNVALYIPSGIYMVPTWLSKSVSFINMFGDGYYTTKIITNVNVSYNTIFVQMTGGGISIEGIHFENFYRVFYFNAELDYIRIQACKGKNNRSYFISSAPYSYGNLSSVVDNVFIADNVIEDCLGFCIFSKVNQVVMTGNRMRNVKVNQALWGSTGHDTNVYGLCVGDGSNKVSAISNYNAKNIVVADNNIYTVYNNSSVGTLNTTNAIMVAGQFASITGNVIDDVTAVDGGNCEAIYTKCLSSIISSNVIVDGTTQSASIAIKGASYGIISKDVLVSDNVIKNVSNNAASGIITYGIDSVSISGNLISNMFEDSIKIFGSPTKLSIIDNIIYQDEGLSAISVRCGDLENAIIDGNVITGFTKSIPASSILKVIFVSSRGKTLKTVVPDSPGSGYTSDPSITYTNPLGGGSTNTEVSISGGQVIGFHVLNSTQEFDMTAAVTSSITGGGGSGATAIATVTQGVIKNLKICKNKINISPKTGGSAEACAILIQATTESNDNFSGIVVDENSVNCDASTTFSTYPYIVGLYIIPPSNKIINDVNVRGMMISGPNVGSVEGVNPFSIKVGSSKYINPYEAYSKFGVFTCGGIFVNGSSRKLLSACNIEDGRVTIVIQAGAFGSIGSNQIGFIPYPCQITKAMLFVSQTPGSSGGTGTIALSAQTAGAKNILASTVANSTNFPFSGWTACKPDFTPANSIRSFLKNVPIYIDVGVEAITSGLMVLTLYTEAMP